MQTHILLGIFPPPLFQTLLALFVVGIIGFVCCYVHRFLVFAVLPVFLAIICLQITSLLRYSDEASVYMLIVYSTVLLDFLAILLGAFLSWKKHLSSLKIFL